MTILSIQSHVAAGHVGGSCAVAALAGLGVSVWTVPTTLLSNHPGRGFPGGGAIEPERIDDLIDGLAANGLLCECDALLSGYLAYAGAAACVARACDLLRGVRSGAIFACDPVLGDDDTGIYVDPELPALAHAELIPRADILLPNAFELEHLTGVAGLAAQAEASLARMRPDGLGVLLVSSVRIEDRIGAALFERGQTPQFIGGPALPGLYRGAGDLLSALFLGHFTSGRSAVEAAGKAVSGVYAALSDLNAACQAVGRAPEPGDDLPVARHACEFASPPYAFRPEPLSLDQRAAHTKSR